MAALTICDEKGAADGRISGSFRDPSGYVFSHEGGIYRAIDEQLHDHLQQLSKSKALSKLIEKGYLVKTEWVGEQEASNFQKEHQGYQHFLRHERLSQITYPYEWSISMLGDAAILTLDLQIELLQQGYELKDATAFNIQFKSGRPIFIDIGSIQKPKRQDLWFALGQFNRHFLFPLLLCRYRGWDLNSYFRSNLDGISPRQVLEAFPGLARWSPKLLLDITLPALLENRNNSSQGKQGWQEAQQKESKNSAGQLLNLKRLRRKIQNLIQGHQPKTVWHDYTATCTYDEEATTAKTSAIEAFLKERTPATVLDLGCNTGTYSWLAAQQGAKVLAVDGDSGAVELVYRRLKSTPCEITPMIVDLSNPSPGLGYLNAERSSFFSRAQSECVFALALIHHLLVSANLSLPAICDLFAALSQRYLILEYVPTDDEQFQRLIHFRENLFEELTVENCIAAFTAKFKLLKRISVKNTKRTLLFFERNTSDEMS